MANVVVMTDSVAGIPKDLMEKYSIKVIPAAFIRYNGDTYIDGVTLSNKEAYDLIKKDPDKFTTSALTPGYIIDEYKKALNDSKQILHLTLSNALSAGFSTATMAASMLMEELSGTTIKVIDTTAVASIQGLIVLAIARAAAQGMKLDDLVKLFPEVRKKTDGIMMLDTLRYVYRTGRMSKLGSTLASLLNIKPINRMTDDGKLELWDKVRDREKGYRKLIDYIKQKSTTKSLHFMVMHAAAPEMADQVIALLKKEFDCLSIIISEYSPVMGYGAGPGCIFIGFHPELDLLK